MGRDSRREKRNKTGGMMRRRVGWIKGGRRSEGGGGRVWRHSGSSQEATFTGISLLVSVFFFFLLISSFYLNEEERRRAEGERKKKKKTLSKGQTTASFKNRTTPMSRPLYSGHCLSRDRDIIRSRDACTRAWKRSWSLSPFPPLKYLF